MKCLAAACGAPSSVPVTPNSGAGPADMKQAQPVAHHDEHLIVLSQLHIKAKSDMKQVRAFLLSHSFAQEPYSLETKEKREGNRSVVCPTP